MSLETGTYISDLDASNPVHASDDVSQGDDHLRLIKATLKATFPSIAGAMTASHVELNYLDGVTGVTGTGNLVLSASPTFTGTLTAANFAGAGAAITALNASNLASGTVPDARFPATLPALNGSALTNLNASAIASGSVPDASLGNAALVNAANTFLASQTQTVAGASRFNINDSSAASGALVRFQANGTRKGEWGITYAGGGIINGSSAGDACITSASGGLVFSGDDGNTKHFALSSAGVLTTPNASAAEVGYKGKPLNSIADNYTLVLTDASKYVKINVAAKTITIPSNASVPFPIGTEIDLGNINSGGDVTIAITSDQLIVVGSGATGSRTLHDWGECTIRKVTATAWMVRAYGSSLA